MKWLSWAVLLWFPLFAVTLAGGVVEQAQQQQQAMPDTETIEQGFEEANAFIAGVKAVASSLYMDVWWLFVAVASFVWGSKQLLCTIKAKDRTFDAFGLFEIEWQRTWPKLRDWLLRGAAVGFAMLLSGLGLHYAPQTLPDVPDMIRHWLPLGFIYGLGTVFMYHLSQWAKTKYQKLRA